MPLTAPTTRERTDASVRRDTPGTTERATLVISTASCKWPAAINKDPVGVITTAKSDTSSIKTRSHAKHAVRIACRDVARKELDFVTTYVSSDSLQLNFLELRNTSASPALSTVRADAPRREPDGATPSSAAESVHVRGEDGSRSAVSTPADET
jgi:hypothetical protein